MGQYRRTNSPGAAQAARQVALIYLAVGLAWVLLSDRLVWWWSAERETVLALQIYKGYLFITATAVLIFLLVERSVRRQLHAHERRRESEAQFRNAFEHAVTGMALVSPELRFTRVNGVLCTMLGYTPELLLGRPIAELIHPAEGDEPVRHLGALLDDRSAPRQMEVRCRHRDGRTLWVLMNATLQRGEAGQPLYFITQIVDVTALHEAEEQARRQQVELARSARLISLGKVSSILAHELNQPLGAILHYAQACRSILPHGARGRGHALAEAMEDVIRQAERAKQIVQRTRAMAKRQTPRAVRVNPNRLVRNARLLLGPQFERYRVSCGAALAEGLPEVAADPQQVEQVLVNLLTNAIEAVAEQPTDARWVQLRTRDEGDRVWVAVRDGGGGVSDQTVERLFESFFTTKEHGLGLGLAISRSIVEAHGGRLIMHRGGTWTQFEFSLPLASNATWLLHPPPLETPDTPDTPETPHTPEPPVTSQAPGVGEPPATMGQRAASATSSSG